MIYRTRENPCNLADQRKEEQLWILEGSATWVLPMSPVHCVTHVSGPDPGLSGAPGGTRTPDLLVRRGISRTTPAHSRRQQPMKSTREGNWFRLVSAGVGQGSRTLTRTLLALPYSCASREVDSGCGVWGKLLARAGKLGWSCAGEELAHCVEEGLGALSFGHDSVDAEMVRSTYFGGVKTEEQNRCS